MSAAPVAINARAASRGEIGGVERLMRELAARLPATEPAATSSPGRRGARPPRRAPLGAGVLPALARAVTPSSPLPANLAPVASRRLIAVLHDAAALRNPGWYSGLYAAYQPASSRRLHARAMRVVTVSEFSRGELVELLGRRPERISVVPGGVSTSLLAAADAGRSRAALEAGAPLRPHVARARPRARTWRALGRGRARLARGGRR